MSDARKVDIFASSSVLLALVSWVILSSPVGFSSILGRMRSHKVVVQASGVRLISNSLRVPCYKWTPSTGWTHTGSPLYFVPEPVSVTFFPFADRANRWIAFGP